VDGSYKVCAYTNKSKRGRKMPGKNWNLDYWDNDRFPTTTPRRVEGGLKVKSERGAIGETWWSKRWLGTLESFDMGSRLTRGRSYARKGQVVSLDITPGKVAAKVQGSQPRPYKVAIELKPLSPEEWDKVATAMAGQAIFAAKLLAGEMPQNIEEAFGAANVALFPRSADELETDCSCPDWANPCKHLAAVYYLMADRFDEDPFLLFKLRGRTKEELIAVLREKRIGAPDGATVAKGEQTGGTSAAEKAAKKLAILETFIGAELKEFADTDATAGSSQDFWGGGQLGASGSQSLLKIDLSRPAVQAGVLKRLGKLPFEMSTTHHEQLHELLRSAYLAGTRYAEGKLKEL
jgi:uncharacterized Zn finger protein